MSTGPGTPHSAETVSETLRVRLEAAQVAQERTRIAMFAATLVSLGIVAAGWNAYLSNYVLYAEQYRKLERESGTHKLQEELLAQWVRSRFISISLLGISVGVDDAPIVGSLALVVATMWLYLTIRRENLSIGYIILDHWEHGNVKLLWHIYHAINSYTIFVRSNPNDMPVSDLERERGDRELKSIGGRFGLISFLFYLPGFSVLFILVCDVISAYSNLYHSPFRPPSKKAVIEAIRVIAPHQEYWLWSCWAIGLALCLYIFFINHRSRQFATATERILHQLLLRLKPKLEPTDV